MENLYIVGIGPGNPEEMTRQAFSVLERSDLIVGYTRYNEIVRQWFPKKEYFETPMKSEQERCEYALKAAESGKKAALICSGDSGVYGMASLTLELAEKRKSPVRIEVVAGISAVLSASARLGAPVSGDFAVISLSDLLTPQSVIERRLRAAAEGDFVIALYNPGSGQRREHLKRACRIIRRSRSGETPCALAKRIGRQGEKTEILSLGELENTEVDMFTTVLIGNSSTRTVETAGRVCLVTPRGYRISADRKERNEEISQSGNESGRQKRILIFGGTTEGRQLAEYACESGIAALVCVATEYGEKMMEPDPLLEISSRGLTEEEITDLMRKEEFLCVMDATHPYASEITEKVFSSCRRTGQEYVRVLRGDAGAGDISDGSMICVGSIREAADFLGRCDGKAVITTGSKEIAEYASVHRAKERFLFRVLPSHEALRACFEAGFDGRNLVCMQGPFSREANEALLRDFGAEFLVTKMSGKNGGFREKTEAAEKAGVKIIAVRPPEERRGITMEEAREKIRRKAPGYDTEVVIAGTGPGESVLLTREAAEAVADADILFGAGRLLKDLQKAGIAGISEHQQLRPEYRADKIAEMIQRDRLLRKSGGKYTVAVSGDSGFFSGTAGMSRLFAEKGYGVKTLPGISSLSYLSAKTGIPWQDAVCISAHGREISVVSEVRTHEKVFVLTGDNAAELMKTLAEFGLGDVRVFAGERLSYENERISEGTAEELAGHSFDILTSLLIINRRARGAVPPGIEDGAFERGGVPMTKREVRAVILSHLDLREDSVVFDIGAGTGSVTVETALTAYRGHVFAVERNREAADLVGKNCRKFAADNVTVLCGDALQVLRAGGQEPENTEMTDGKRLPLPDAVFIGGTGGKLADILDALISLRSPGREDGGPGHKKETVRTVISAVTVETIGSAFQTLTQLGAENLSAVQISAARTRKAGSHHLLEAQNPVFIISADLAYRKGKK